MVVKSFKSIKTEHEKNFAQLLEEETGVPAEVMIIVRRTIATKAVYCIEVTESEQADDLMDATIEHFRPERRGRKLVMFWATSDVV
jgi:hypothetical protein